jgi:hypothetical protein
LSQSHPSNGLAECSAGIKRLQTSRRFSRFLNTTVI